MRPSEEEREKKLKEIMERAALRKELSEEDLRGIDEKTIERFYSKQDIENIKKIVQAAMIEGIKVNAEAVAFEKILKEVKEEVQAKIDRGEVLVKPKFKRSWHAFAKDMQYDFDRLVNSGEIFIDYICRNKYKLGLIASTVGGAAYAGYQLAIFASQKIGAQSVAKEVGKNLAKKAMVHSAGSIIGGGVGVAVGAVIPEAAIVASGSTLLFSAGAVTGAATLPITLPVVAVVGGAALGGVVAKKLYEEAEDRGCSIM